MIKKIQWKISHIKNEIFNGKFLQNLIFDERKIITNLSLRKSHHFCIDYKKWIIQSLEKKITKK